MLSRSCRASSGASAGVLPRLTMCLGPRTSGCRVERQDAAGGEPVEHHPDGGEVLLNGRGGMSMAEFLYISGDVDRTHRRNRGHAVVLQPSPERADRPHVGPAGVRVADLGGEELQEAVGGAITGGIDQSRGTRTP